MHGENLNRSDWNFLLGLIAGSLVLKLLLIDLAALDLHFDEAQYWSWSQKLDLSYYSKGPLVAWINACTTFLFGRAEWAVRLPAWICHALAIIVLYRFSLDLWSSRDAARWSSLAFIVTPLYFTLGMVQTTDIYMLTFWLTTLWALYRALFRAEDKYWYLAGFAVGIGSLSKLSIGLLPAAAGITILAMAAFDEHIRSRLKSIHPWIAIGLIFALMSPLLIWNAQNEWLMFKHDAGHVNSSGFSLKVLGEFVGGQLGILSPIICVLLFSGLRHTFSKQLPLRFLCWITLILLAFFLSKALTGKVQINWPAPLYLTLFPLWAGRFGSAGNIYKRVVTAGFLISVIIIAATFFPNLVGVEEGRGPFKKVKGWQQGITDVYHQSPKADFLILSYYSLAGEFAFYWPEQIDVYVEPDPVRRMNQYDLWAEDIAKHTGGSALFIGYYQLPPHVSSRFESCTPAATVPSLGPDQTVIRTYQVFHCLNFNGENWPRFTQF